jgi:hypothetical protein
MHFLQVLEAERVRLSLLQEKIQEVLGMLRTLNAMVGLPASQEFFFHETETKFGNIAHSVADGRQLYLYCVRGRQLYCERASQLYLAYAPRL